jgi:tripeptidyl-peptidase-1
MSAQEVIDFFAPHESSVDVVQNWLHSAGISKNRVALSANKQVAQHWQS